MFARITIWRAGSKHDPAIRPNRGRHWAISVLTGAVALWFGTTIRGAAPSAPADTTAPTQAEVSAATPASASAQGWEVWRDVFAKNIFDEERSGRRAAPEIVERPREETRRPEPETLVLLGTLSYAQDSYGYFGGSREDYRKAVPLASRIAGWQVTHIDPEKVRLQSEDKVLELPVGMQLSRRDDQGEWVVEARSLVASRTTSREREDNRYSDRDNDDERGRDRDDDGDRPADEGNGEASDILKRLLQKRQQELEP